MKTVSGETMQLMDRRAIGECGIPGSVLMENAGKGCATAILSRFGSESRKLLIVAGKGNNGGDGYVIARLLAEAGWEVRVLVLAQREAISGDARLNLDLLPNDILTFAPEGPGAHRDLFSWPEIIVDALLGTGLKSEVRGAYAEAIDLINGAGRPVVAVDIASGIDAANGRILGKAVQAELTVTFALPKIGNVLYPGAGCCGTLRVADIGMPPRVVEEAPGAEFVDVASAAGMLRPRSPVAHKGSCGHVLVIAGSTGKTGAAAMAANTAVRTGSGLITLAVPASLNPILEEKSTEAMTIPIPDHGHGHLPAGALSYLVAAAEGRDAVALGPGIGAARTTFYLVHSLLPLLSMPLVIDADGLNAVAADPGILLQRRGAVTVLTPHPGEMARLTGLTVAEVEGDRMTTAREFARKYGVHLILKGARTIVAAPDGAVAINGSGNAGMASGGMGDVLTGVLVSLLGQGYAPFEACMLGVFLHGHAADLVARQAQVGMKASEVQETIPAAIADLIRHKAPA